VVVDNVDLDADAGEVLGVAGLTGSGREEILQLVFGHSTRDGDVIANGTLVRPCRPPEAMRAGVAYVPADRRGQGSIETMSVQENCTLTELQRHTRSAFRLSRAAESDEVKGWITQLDVRPDDPHAVFATLSGGNQQKVVIAKWLRTNPAVLLLDEPTQGVDVASKAVIHHLARNAADKGAAVVIASSDENELCDVCDRVIVLKDGRVAAELSGTSLTPHAIALAQLGGPVPTQDAA
jgi:ribose transport system ATP-binding protein